MGGNSGIENKPVVLGLDTSGKTASVALSARDGIVACSSAEDNFCAEVVVNLIAQLFSSSGYSWDNIETVAVAIGPGSYTGIRTGIATALGMNLGRELAVIPVPVLAARSIPFLGKARFLVPQLSTGTGEQYVSILEARRVNEKRFDQNRTTLKSWELVERVGLKVMRNDEVNEYVQTELSRFSGSLQADDAHRFSIDLDQGPDFNPAAVIAQFSMLGAFLPLHPYSALEPSYGKPVSAKTLNERRQARAER